MEVAALVAAAEAEDTDPVAVEDPESVVVAAASPVVVNVTWTPAAAQSSLEI